MKRCTACGESKSFSEFHKNNKAKDKLSYHCRSCVKVKFKAYNDAVKVSEAVLRPTSKVCLDCKLEKPISQYGKKSSSLDKHQSYCKPCWRIRSLKAMRKMYANAR